MNFYRSDGWVKLVSGQAVSGAQVYILKQPANVVAPITPPRTLPIPFVPNPQVQVYSDAGFTPVSQPIITDGFGHYDFYTLPGLYTVAIFTGGKLQQYYIDQSVGNVGSGLISSLVLQTNGSPNFNQGVLNLQQGANVVLTPDNFGTVTIASTGGGTSVEVAGTPLSSSTLLNLVNSGNVTFTDLGGGQVSASAPPLSGALPTPDKARYALWQVSSNTWLTSLDTITAGSGGGGSVTGNAASASGGESLTINNSVAFNGLVFVWPTRTINFLSTCNVTINSTNSTIYWGLSNIAVGTGLPDPTTGDSILIGISGVGTNAGNWLIVTSIGGVKTTVNSGVAVVQGVRNSLKLIVTGGVATMYVNGTAIATSSTLPTAHALGIVFWNFTNGFSIATTVEYMYVDSSPV
jgi:hypothetical protein